MRINWSWIALAHGRWLHLKRGTTYEIKGLAQVTAALLEDGDEVYVNPTKTPGWYQVSGANSGVPLTARVQCETNLTSNDTVLLYQDVNDGTLSIRRPAEFFDGRFKLIE